MKAEAFSLKIKGHVLIKDADSGEILLDKYNAIHPQNMSLAVARSLANMSTGYVFSMALGNGGTSYNVSSQLVYNSPNIIGSGAALYNQTYVAQVNANVVGTPSGNSVVASASPTPATSAMIVATMTLGTSIPSGQAATDGVSTTKVPYMFDELGLKTSDGLLMSHIIFSPIEKTANRSMLITYTIVVSAT